MCIKFVIETSLYYDARSDKRQTTRKVDSEKGKQDRQYTYNVTLSLFRATIVEVDKQQVLRIPSVSL